MNSIIDEIAACRVIAAVRDDDGIARACESPARVIFLLGGGLIGLDRRVERIKARYVRTA